MRAQVNRSATELAKENIRNYLVTKIFDSSYQEVFYGTLKQLEGYHRDIAWTIDHTGYTKNEKGERKQAYRFTFYLNDRMKVFRAERVDESPARID